MKRLDAKTVIATALVAIAVTAVVRAVAPRVPVLKNVASYI